MLHSPQLERILRSALDGVAPTREDCIYLLKLPSESLESGMALSCETVRHLKSTAHGLRMAVPRSRPV